MQGVRADYEQRLMAMAGDMGGMQEEMKSRTVFMTREMQRYQLAAASTAQVRLCVLSLVLRLYDASVGR